MKSNRLTRQLGDRYDAAVRSFGKRAADAIIARELSHEHIPLSTADRKLVLRAAAILEQAPRDYARTALVAQSRAVVELHAHGHFKAAKERGAKRGD